MNLNESIVEYIALEWFGELDCFCRVACQKFASSHFRCAPVSSSATSRLGSKASRLLHYRNRSRSWRCPCQDSGHGEAHPEQVRLSARSAGRGGADRAAAGGTAVRGLGVGEVS